MSSGSIYVCRDPGCPKAQWPLALRAFCWIRDQGSCFLWTSAKISLLLKCFTGSQVLDKGVLNGLHLSSWVKTSAILCCHLSSGLDLGNFPTSLTGYLLECFGLHLTFSVRGCTEEQRFRTPKILRDLHLLMVMSQAWVSDLRLELLQNSFYWLCTVVHSKLCFP